MASPARILVPLILGAAAATAAALGAALGRSRDAAPQAIAPPVQPLRFNGWWNSDHSSALAVSHPSVVFVDATNGAVVDSWDRRRHARLPAPVAHRTSEWPRTGILVVDAVTGDLLSVLEAPGIPRG
ncbi:hypothetical protein [Humidisolicoccus flavus]|uniref:hypothetical protein n=1 Tax=Humidisolicoccus flavus TaxID=3111414 RepID=UPI00324B250E